MAWPPREGRRADQRGAVLDGYLDRERMRPRKARGEREIILLSGKTEGEDLAGAGVGWGFDSATRGRRNGGDRKSVV